MRYRRCKPRSRDERSDLRDAESLEAGAIGFDARLRFASSVTDKTAGLPSAPLLSIAGASDPHGGPNDGQSENRRRNQLDGGRSARERQPKQAEAPPEERKIDDGLRIEHPELEHSAPGLEVNFIWPSVSTILRRRCE